MKTTWLLTMLSLLSSYAALSQTTPGTERQVDNLQAFAHLYGLVRYYNPAKGLEKTDWNNFAQTGTVMMYNAETDPQAIAALQQLFYGLQAGIKISDVPIKVPDYTAFRGRWRYWRHSGFNDQADGRKVAGAYKSKIKTTGYKRLPEPLQNRLPAIFDTVGGYIHFRTPIVAKPRYRSKPLPLPIASEAVTAKNMYLANIIMAWNELVHFQPYITAKEPWDTVLRECLDIALKDTTEKGFEAAMVHLLLPLKDSHAAFLKDGKPVGAHLAYPPVHTYWIENELVVIGSEDTTLPVSRGDKVLTVNGKPATDYAKDFAANVYWAGTDHGKLSYAGYLCMYGPDSSMIEMTVQDSVGNVHRLEMMRRDYRYYLEKNNYCPAKMPAIYELEPGIYYVNMLILTKEDLKKNLKTLTTAKGLVCEMRGYPAYAKVAVNLLRHFTTEKLEGMHRYVPITSGPKWEGYGADTTSHSYTWKFGARKPLIDCPKVFLTNFRAQSYAETIMSFVREYNMGTIVGGNTEGVNGVYNLMELPGGYSVRYTGMKVWPRNSPPIYAVGIAPDIVCEPTIEAIKTKTDNCREEALAVLKGLMR